MVRQRLRRLEYEDVLGLESVSSVVVSRMSWFKYGTGNQPRNGWVPVVGESTSVIPNIVMSPLPVLPPNRGSSWSLGDEGHLVT